MKIFIAILFAFIANTFCYLTEQVSSFVPQQDKSITTKPNRHSSSIDKINNIDINMRDIIIAIDTRTITETNNSNRNTKRRKRNRRRRRRNNNHHNDRNKQSYTQHNYNEYYQEDTNYNDNNDDTIINQYNLDNTYY